MMKAKRRLGKLGRAVLEGRSLEWDGNYGFFKILARKLERQLRPLGYSVEGEWRGPDGEKILHQFRVFSPEGELVAVLNYWHSRPFFTTHTPEHRGGYIALIPIDP